MANTNSGPDWDFLLYIARIFGGCVHEIEIMAEGLQKKLQTELETYKAIQKGTLILIKFYLVSEIWNTVLKLLLVTVTLISPLLT